MMLTFILILFLELPNQTTASVRIGFDSRDTCVAAAKTTTDALKAQDNRAQVVWSCVQQ